jgi:predicted O-methyltransferase YrrM
MIYDDVRKYIDNVKDESWGIGEDDGIMLHALIRAIKPKLVFEVGTWRGVSALWIISGLIENGSGKLITCDIGDYGVKDVFKSLGVDKWVEFRQTDSRIAKEYDIDIAFIDGGHELKDVEEDFKNITMKNKPFLIFHDCNFEMSIGLFLTNFKNKIILPTLCGMALCANY